MMAESTVESNSGPQLPLDVLTKLASMYPSNYRDRVQLASVSRQLRQAVFDIIQQIKRRHMAITFTQENVNVSGIIVENDLRSSYSQMDCVVALLAFGQPTSLALTRLLSQHLPILCSLPPSLTHLFLGLWVDEIGETAHHKERESKGKEREKTCLPLDQILKTVASLTNLEALTIRVLCWKNSAAATHKNSSPSVPKDSPFNHLLTLKNLRALRISAAKYLSPTQMADLLNRSESKITHICCQDYCAQERDKLFEVMSDFVRGNIASICCVRLDTHQALQLPRFDRLLNCATIHFDLWSPSFGRQKFDVLGDRLLDVCCAVDVHPGRTLECSVGCGTNSLQEYVEGGGETQMEYARNDTVVRLSIGSVQMTYMCTGRA